MEILISFFTGKALAYVGGSIGVLILAWILKKIPNDKFNPMVEKCFYGIGWVITGWATKRLPKVWNKLLEPWIVDLIDNVIGAAVRGFINGLRSDNGKD